MALKRDFLDAAFSDLIREAHDWTCARCGKDWPERKGQDAHCSHFYSRGAGNSLRYNVLNACLLCAECHAFVTRFPDEHTKFFTRLIGPGQYEQLREDRRRIFKLSKQDKKDMAAHYRAEIKRIQLARAQGLTGYLAPVAWM